MTSALHVRLDVELRKRLDALAKRNKTTLTAVVDHILDFHMELSTDKIDKVRDIMKLTVEQGSIMIGQIKTLLKENEGKQVMICELMADRQLLNKMLREILLEHAKTDSVGLDVEKLLGAAYTKTRTQEPSRK